MNKVIMLFIDAFSSKYLDSNKTPLLTEVSRKGYYTPLKPMFAFQGIGASIFSGTSPNLNNIWCDWVLKRGVNKLHPTSLRYFLMMSELIPNDRLSKDCRYILYKVYSCDFGTPNLVPHKLLSNFELKLKKSYLEKNSLGEISTIFEQLTRFNKKYFVYGIDNSCTDDDAIKKLFESLKAEYDLYLIKLSSLDSLGHQHGPNSNEVQERLIKIDTQVRYILKYIQNSNDSIHLVIFSDHGMSYVSNHVNLTNILKKTSLNMSEDYIVFLDSTVARFWFFNNNAKNRIINEISQLTCGKILNKHELINFNIDNIGYEYGELFFALNEGYVFHPDFFRRHNPPKGMHGYAYPNDKPVLIIKSPDKGVTYTTQSEAQLTDILPTVLDLLEIPIPITCEGTSLLETH